jgi:DNA polymerase
MENLVNPRQARLPIALKDPFKDGCKFTHCGLHGQSYPVRPRGSWDAEALWVAEAPGVQEEKKNCTFIGPAGKLVEEVTEVINLPFDKNFLVCNATFCRPYPPAGSTKQNRTPTPSEIESCRPHLEKIVRLHNPKVIVLVGGQAVKAVMNNPSSVSKIVGKFFSPEQHNFPIEADLYVIWHPAYILRNMSEKQEWIKQLVRLRDYMIGLQIKK